MNKENEQLRNFISLISRTIACVSAEITYVLPDDDENFDIKILDKNASEYHTANSSNDYDVEELGNLVDGLTKLAFEREMEYRKKAIALSKLSAEERKLLGL